MDTIEADGELEPAIQRLEVVVHALADPAPVWDGRVCRWTDSLYSRLRQILGGRKGPGGVRVVAGSRSPCNMGALNLVMGIDAYMEGLEPGKGDTVDRLHRLVGRGWRPQDVAGMDEISARLEQWVVEVSQLLGDETATVSLRVPCPSCRARFVYRQKGWETLRSDALRVSENGCVCLACDAEWPPEEFHWLARLLGCDELPDNDFTEVRKVAG